MKEDGIKEADGCPAKSARPHRTHGLEMPTGPPFLVVPPVRSSIVVRPILGGLHHEYEWEAA